MRQCSGEIYTMQVKYVLFVFYCAVPFLLHMVDSQEHCMIGGLTNEDAYCTPSYTNRTLDYVPRISHRILFILLNWQPLRQLPRNAFQNISSQNELIAISVCHCQIQYIDAEAFMNLNNLKDLYMIENSISRFETGTFQHIKQLVRLIANNNKIERLQTGLFHNLVHLNSVYLRNNNISCIDKDTFRNTSLSSIDVTYNKLEYLSPLFTDNFVNVTEPLVEANPWNCDCNLKEFYEGYKVKTPQIISNPECENPPELRGRNWFDLTSDAFICDKQIILPTDISRESIPRIIEPISSIRELVSTITINEPGIVIKESGTRINELSTSKGPNATTTIEVTVDVVLQLPKNLSWLENVHVTPVRVTHQTNKTSFEASTTTEENAQPSEEYRNAQSNVTRAE